MLEQRRYVGCGCPQEEETLTRDYLMYWEIFDRVVKEAPANVEGAGLYRDQAEAKLSQLMADVWNEADAVARFLP